MVKEKKMPPSSSGSIVINEGGGPFNYGDVLTFTTSVNHMQGGHPMVEVALFQDREKRIRDDFGNVIEIVPPDGVITVDLFSEDLVGLTLNHPEQPVSLPPGGSTDVALAAKGWARLLRYATKGGQQTITQLDRVDFDVGP